MRYGLKMIAGALLAGASTAALAGDDAVPSLDSDQFLIGQAPASVMEGVDRERPQAVNGSLYAVVAPLYLGLNNDPISYLRLFNGGGSTATFTVKVVGSPTGRDYGTATFEIPTAATRQLALFEVLQGAGASIEAPDTNFSFYIQSAEPLAGYQHVTHKPSVSYFENAAVCKATIQDVILAASSQMVLPSIHTSRLAAAGYPSSIELHNFANAAITYRFFVRDEITGRLIGQTDFSAQANSSYTIPWSQIESAVGWSPASNEIRANLIVTDPSGAPPAILLGQTIINNTLGVTLNMTTMCAVNKPTSSGGGGDGGIGGGGGITY